MQHLPESPFWRLCFSLSDIVHIYHHLLALSIKSGFRSLLCFYFGRYYFLINSTTFRPTIFILVGIRLPALGHSKPSFGNFISRQAFSAAPICCFKFNTHLFRSLKQPSPSRLNHLRKQMHSLSGLIIILLFISHYRCESASSFPVLSEIQLTASPKQFSA